MSWKDKMRELGGGDVAFLTEDGECITFVVILDPILIEGKYQGKATQRIGAPIITEDGFALLVMGKRAARRLAKHEKHFKDQAFDMVRHGEPNDTHSKYFISRCTDEELEKRLLEVGKVKVSQQEINDAVAAAEDMANG